MKRKKQEEGFLQFDRIQAGNSDTRDLSAAIKESLQHVGYTGQLKTLQDLAAKSGVEVDELQQAEELIKSGGGHFEIKGLLKDAKYKIQIHAVNNHRNWLSRIVRAFRLETDRWENRAKRALNALGITTGKRQAKYDKEHLFDEYMKLREGTDGEYLGTPLAKWAAIEVIQKRHEMASREAALKHLRLYVSEKKKALQAAGKSVEHLKRILPGNPTE